MERSHVAGHPRQHTKKVIYKYGWKDSTSSLFGQAGIICALRIPASNMKILLYLSFPAIVSSKSKNGLF